MTVRVAVIDLGTSNIGSLTSALEYLGAGHEVGSEPGVLTDATHVILPGVGAYDAAMQRIQELSLAESLRRSAAERPMLGVCLGMQLLFTGSEEGSMPGLGLLPGRLRRLAAAAPTPHKVPHVGFSLVHGYRPVALFNGLGSAAYFYFTHSYALPALDDSFNVAVCDHAQPFVAAFQAGSLCGAQFHPEKSQASGLRLLSNFLELE